MEYQVWTKDEYGDNYTKVDCGDLAAAKREIEKAIRLSKEPTLTVEVPYEYNIKIGEAGVEVKKSKTKPDKVAGDKGDGEVRRGDEEDTEGLDKGSGDPGAGPGTGDRG